MTDLESPTVWPPSLWQLKPWWCQPWSIVATGTGAIAIAHFLSHRWWMVAPVAVGVGLWWAVFLIIVPRQYRAMVAAAPGTAIANDAASTEGGSSGQP
ncbi:MAG: hypothetical protein O3C67_13665 [Cyanobacteria bacterium]|nr:hypothetical protein [Cyanobacteriota bacterium]